MSSPDSDRVARPNPEARRYARPGEASPRVRALFGIAVLVCGWLLVVVTGFCTAGLMNPAPYGWRHWLTWDGLLFILVFGCIPIFGGIAMLLVTIRAIRKRRRASVHE